MRIAELINFRTFTYNWDVIESIPEFAKLKECQQSDKWHAEGTAWVHTKAVCNEAVKVCREREWEDEPWLASRLLTSALFHDIGKGVTTHQGKDGRWHSYGHEDESEKIARLLLWDEGYEFREDICSLVKYHMCPLNMFERKDYLEQLVYISKKIPSWALLILLKQCDLEGSTQIDEISKQADRLKLRDLTFILSYIGAYYSPSHIPMKGQRRFEVYTKEHSPAPKIDVTVLIGLSGAGKSTYLENINGDIFIASRDVIRAELGFCKCGEKVVCNTEQEKEVSEVFNKKILNAVKKGQKIVIDNLNLKRKYRDAYKTLLANYNVNWHYVYVEAPTLADNLNRRSDCMSKDIYEKMILGFEWPSPSEYNDFIKIVTE